MMSGLQYSTQAANSDVLFRMLQALRFMIRRFCFLERPKGLEFEWADDFMGLFGDSELGDAGLSGTGERVDCGVLAFIGLKVDDVLDVILDLCGLDEWGLVEERLVVTLSSMIG